MAASALRRLSQLTHISSAGSGMDEYVDALRGGAVFRLGEALDAFRWEPGRPTRTKRRLAALLALRTYFKLPSTEPDEHDHLFSIWYMCFEALMHAGITFNPYQVRCANNVLREMYDYFGVDHGSRGVYVVGEGLVGADTGDADLRGGSRAVEADAGAAATESCHGEDEGDESATGDNRSEGVARGTTDMSPDPDEETEQANEGSDGEAHEGEGSASGVDDGSDEGGQSESETDDNGFGTGRGASVRVVLDEGQRRAAKRRRTRMVVLPPAAGRTARPRHVMVQRRSHGTDAREGQPPSPSPVPRSRATPGRRSRTTDVRSRGVGEV